MKRMKHLFTALLLLCATMSMAHDFEVDGIFYGITDAENRTVAVTYSGSAYSEVADEYTGSVVIPSTVTYEDVTYSVTAVAESAFRDCAGLTYLFIPNSIVNVGNYAFNGCAALRELYIEDGEELLTMGYSYYESNGIGYGQFRECPLETLHLGRNLSYETDLSAGLSPFSSLSTLTNVTIGDYVTSIGYALFYYNAGITEITLPNGVTSIGGNAFIGCEGLTSIVIPSSVTSVGGSAFLYCSKLKTVVNFSNLSFTLGDRFGNGSIGYEADVVVNAPNGFFDGDYVFGNVDGVNILAGYIGSDTELVLPADCNGESYDIGDKAFYNNSAITSIVMPDCVTAIGDDAFRGCSALADIELSDNLISIGATAFYNCNSLESFTIGDSVESIGEDLFYTNTSLKSLYIGRGLRTIGSNAFSSCKALETVTIAEGVTTIGESMFSSCTNLKSIVIPNSVTSIGRMAFSGAGLSNIVMGDGVKTIGEKAFLQCYSLKSVVIGSSVTTIYNQAFFNCTGLSKIVLGKNVSNIVNEAFYGCSNLKTIVNLSNLSLTRGSTNNGYVAYYVDKIVSAPNGVIDGDYIWSVADGVNTLVVYMGNATELTLPADYNGEDYRIGASAFSGNTTLTSVTIPDAVESIGNYAFNGCSSLASVTMGSGVASIGNYAFSGCSLLASIEIPNSVATIGTDVFRNCAALASVSMGNGITTIGSSTFYGCSSLASITIPNSVTTIGSNAFKGCSALTSIEIPDAVTSLGGSVFENCTSLASVSIGGGVTSIGNFAFNGCTALKDLRFEDGEGTLILGYKTSSQGLFYDCPLESLYLGRNLSYNTDSSYGYSPFYNKTTLKDVAFGDNFTMVGSYLFYNCSGLTSVELPDGVTSIGNHAFYGCSNLTGIELSEGLVSIGNYAFYNCSKLADVKIPSNLTTIATYTFYGCKGLTSVIIPNNVTSIGGSAFYNCSNLKTVINLSSLSLSKANSSNGYVSYYADRLYNVPGGIIDGDYIWSVADGVNTLAAYMGNATELTLPANYNGEDYRIGASVFSGNTTLTSVTIPDAITSIGNDAFKGCTALASVSMGGGVASIGNYAFSGCSVLTGIELPDAVKTIGTYVFQNCTKLASISMGNGVASIGNYAFAGCSSLASIIIPNSVTTIGTYVFQNCKALASVSIGGGVTSIGNYAFNGCTALKDLRFEDGEGTLSLGYYTSVTSGTGKGLFYDCPLETLYIGRTLSYSTNQYEGYSPFYQKTSLTTLVIGGEATSIGIKTFYGCSGIANLTIGDKVTSIGNDAFNGCSSLASVSMGNGVASIGDYAFSGCSVLTGIELPNAVTSIGNCTFRGCTKLASVSMGNGVASIGNYAFGGCKALSGITIPDAVTSLGAYVFENCTSLASVSIGGGVTSIGNNAFNGCTALTDLRFEDGEGTLTLGYKTSSQGLYYDCPLESLYLGRNLSYNAGSSYGYSPFYNKTTLKDVAFGDKVTSIGNYLFYGCSSLASVSMGNGVASIGDYAFSGCSALTSIELPDAVTNLGTCVFQNCTKLASISMGNGVASIGNYAFYGCSSLASITIPNSVTTIGTYVFQNCTALESVSIGGGVESIGNYAFNGCTALKDLRFEDGEGTLTLGYKTSSQGLFYDCPLESLYLGRNLSYTSSSSYSPFYSRTALTSLTIGDKVTSIGNYLFYGCSNIAEVIVPSNITSIGTQAFYNCKSLKSVINFSGLTFTAGATTHGYIAYYVDKLINAPGGSVEGDFVFAEIDGVNKLIKYIYSGEYVDDNTELDAWTSTNTAHSSTSSHTYTIEAKKDGKLTFDWKVSSESSFDWLTVTIDGTEIIKKSGELSGNYQHTFTSDGTHTLVVKYTKDGSQSKGDDMGKIYNIVVQSLVEDDYELLLPADYKGEEYVIAENAFTGHIGMNSVEIPATVTAIGANAFNGCTGLTAVTSHIAGDNLFAIDENVFSGVDKENCTLYVPWDAIETYASTEGWSSFYEIKKILPAQVVITIGSYGSATYSSPYALDFSAVEGLSAYTATNCNVNNVVITLTKVDIANEATGLLLIGTPGEYTVPVVEDLGETAPNLFVATLKKTAVNSTSQDGEYANFKYTVKSGDTSPKFYRFADGSTLSAGKAYLQLPVSLFPQGASKTISLKFEDGTTEIEDVEGEDCGAAVVYDLQGRVVNNPTKGIYIVNGKKVVIK